MGKQPTIPEGPAFTDAWRALDRDTKRRIRRAVNRGQAAENRREAALAVVIARSQQRFWRFAWLFGPALALVLMIREPLAVVVANAILALLVFALMAVLFTRRARRAEAANLERARQGKRKRDDRGSGKKPKGGRKR